MSVSDSRLTFNLRRDYSFRNFRTGPNASAIESCRSRSRVWLYGAKNVGKSHLLHALCEEIESAIYIDNPRAELASYSAFDLVCVDHLDNWLGDRPFELALHALYEGLVGAATRLIFCSQNHPAMSTFVHPDLRSRSVLFHPVELIDLNDDDLKALFAELAVEKGLTLGDGVIEYLFPRIPPAQQDVLSTFSQIDRASYSQGRRITVPFVKKALDLD